MAKLRMKVDDVLLGLKGQMEPATGRETVKLPAYATDDGRRATVRFDVSENGRSELDKLVSQVTRKCEEIDERAARDKKAAWKPVYDLIEKSGKEAEQAEKKYGGRRKASAQDADDVAQGDESHPEAPASEG